MYHVPGKEAALHGSLRVLLDGGLLVIDDLLKLKPVVSAEFQPYVYDRLLFDIPFSFTGYQDYLQRIGLTILEAEDMSVFLRHSYQLLSAEARDRARGELEEKLSTLAFTYDKMVEAIDNNEIGWGLYIAQAG